MRFGWSLLSGLVGPVLVVVSAALRRLTDYYLHTAYAGDRLLDTTPPSFEPANTSADGRRFNTPAAALTWLDAEHANLLASQRLAAAKGWDTQVWQLASVLGLAQTYAALSEHRQARATWEQALQLYQAQHRTIDAERIRHHLAMQCR